MTLCRQVPTPNALRQFIKFSGRSGQQYETAVFLKNLVNRILRVPVDPASATYCTWY
eukprot:SAG31_NODE_928_length_10927_cov_4.616273_3_plen_57_part_00